MKKSCCVAVEKYWNQASCWVAEKCIFKYKHQQTTSHYLDWIGGQWAVLLEQFKICPVIPATYKRFGVFPGFCFIILVTVSCWWLVQLLGKSYGCVIQNMSMRLWHIIEMTCENMISFKHVTCLHSESLRTGVSFLSDISESRGSRLRRQL